MTEINNILKYMNDLCIDFNEIEKLEDISEYKDIYFFDDSQLFHENMVVPSMDIYFFHIFVKNYEEINNNKSRFTIINKLIFNPIPKTYVDLFNIRKVTEIKYEVLHDNIINIYHANFPDKDLPNIRNPLTSIKSIIYLYLISGLIINKDLFYVFFGDDYQRLYNHRRGNEISMNKVNIIISHYRNEDYELEEDKDEICWRMMLIVRDKLRQTLVLISQIIIKIKLIEDYLSKRLSLTY